MLPLAIWLGYIAALVLVLPIAGYLGRGSLLCAAIVVALNWCADETYTLATGQTSPAAFNLAVDFAFFAWFATRADFGARLFSLSYAAMAVLHGAQLSEPGDALAYWYRWAAGDFAQLGLLAGWIIGRGRG